MLVENKPAGNVNSYVERYSNRNSVRQLRAQMAILDADIPKRVVICENRKILVTNNKINDAARRQIKSPT